jgi:hypothetical protein
VGVRLAALRAAAELCRRRAAPRASELTASPLLAGSARGSSLSRYSVVRNKCHEPARHRPGGAIRAGKRAAERASLGLPRCNSEVGNGDAALHGELCPSVFNELAGSCHRCSELGAAALIAESCVPLLSSGVTAWLDDDYVFQGPEMRHRALAASDCLCLLFVERPSRSLDLRRSRSRAITGSSEANLVGLYFTPCQNLSWTCWSL